MKRLFLLVISTITLSAFAQSHASFLGKSFSNPNMEEELVLEGRIKYYGEDIYNLDFADKKMRVMFHHVDDNPRNPIYDVNLFSEEGNWNDTKSIYMYFKDLFKKKYKLTEEVEITGCEGGSLKPSVYAFYNIKNQDGLFASSFKIPGGSAIIVITPMPSDSAIPKTGLVTIIYADSAYRELNKRGETNKALNDI